MTINYLILIAAFFAAVGVALCASPWLLRETHKDNPLRRIRLRFRELGGASRIPDLIVKPFTGDSLGVIASRRLCFGLLLGAVAVTAGMILPHGPASVALGLVIPSRKLIHLPPGYAFRNAVRAQASANPILTNYAVGLAQDMQSALAEFLAPTVEVGSTIGHFKKFDDKNAFQIYDTARAIGGAATRIEFETSDPTYNAKPQALEVTVDDAERDAAGTMDPLKLDMAKIKTLVGASALSHEAKVIALVVNAKAAEGGLGVWSDVTKDPVDEIDGLIEAISIETGMLPNRVAWGIGAWKAFRSHPKVIARQPGAQLIGLSMAQAAAMFLNPSMEHRVGVLSKDTTKFGKAKSAVNIMGAQLIIFIGAQTPTDYDPSFAKTFTGQRGGVTQVWDYREPRYDVHAVDWSEDIQITGLACGKRIVLS